MKAIKLLDKFNPCRRYFYPFFRIVKIFIPENSVKSVAVYTYVVITYISQETVCGVALNVFIYPFFLE